MAVIRWPRQVIEKCTCHRADLFAWLWHKINKYHMGEPYHLHWPALTDYATVNKCQIIDKSIKKLWQGFWMYYGFIIIAFNIYINVSSVCSDPDNGKFWVFWSDNGKWLWVFQFITHGTLPVPLLIECQDKTEIFISIHMYMYLICSWVNTNLWCYSHHRPTWSRYTFNMRVTFTRDIIHLVNIHLWKSLNIYIYVVMNMTKWHEPRI